MPTANSSSEDANEPPIPRIRKKSISKKQEKTTGSGSRNQAKSGKIGTRGGAKQSSKEIESNKRVRESVRGLNKRRRLTNTSRSDEDKDEEEESEETMNVGIGARRSNRPVRRASQGRKIVEEEDNDEDEDEGSSEESEEEGRSRVKGKRNGKRRRRSSSVKGRGSRKKVELGSELELSESESGSGSGSGSDSGSDDGSDRGPDRRSGLERDSGSESDSESGSESDGVRVPRKGAVAGKTLIKRGDIMKKSEKYEEDEEDDDDEDDEIVSKKRKKNEKGKGKNGKKVKHTTRESKDSKECKDSRESKDSKDEEGLDEYESSPSEDEKVGTSRPERLTSRQRAMQGESVELEYTRLESPKQKAPSQTEEWDRDEEMELKRQQKARLRQVIHEKRNKEKRAAMVDRVLRGVTSKRKKFTLASEARAAKVGSRLTQNEVREGCMRYVSNQDGVTISFPKDEDGGMYLGESMKAEYPRPCKIDPKTGKRIFI